MSKMDDIRLVYFLGIGGIGMSALARWFRQQGKAVAGYDRTPSPLTRELEEEGCRISYVDEVASIPEDIREGRRKEQTLVVYTPAIPEENTIRQWFISKDYTLHKRARVLGLISATGKTLAVAGTHGKTTVSSILAHLMKQSEADCSAFLGGIALNYQTNFLKGELPWIVAEADEYDRSFHQLSVEHGVITALDPDHLDIYKTYENLQEAFLEFARGVKGELLVHQQLADFFRERLERSFKTYSLEGPADYYISSRGLEQGSWRFDFCHPGGKMENLLFTWPGGINLENATAAIALAMQVGVREDEIRKALLYFKGVRRRFEKVVEKPDLLYMDDYAHHPKEIEAVLSTVRETWPGKRVLVLFQPHLYSRTRDFAAEFAQALDQADEVVLLPIYPAREEPMEGVTSKLIYDKMFIIDRHLVDKNEILDFLEQKHIEILLTLGAGDIDRLVPLLREKLQS